MIKIVKENNSSLFFKLLNLYGKLQGKLYDIHNTIVISGFPRSGTTWLAEVFNTIKYSNIISEPIRTDFYPEQKALGFDWRPFIAPGTDWPEAEKCIRRILTGQILDLRTTRYCKLSEILRNRYWIIKFIRANRLLRWMTERFTTRPPILLIRHPCAVVASIMRQKDWFGPAIVVDLNFLKAYPQFRNIVNSAKYEEEIHTINWCLDYYIPLSTPLPYPWLLVTYEMLVSEGEKEIERIFNEIGFPVNNNTLERLNIPSKSVRHDSYILKGKDPLVDWKNYLNNDQIKHILNIVSYFGLDFYGEDLEPDYHKLATQGYVNKRSIR